MVKRNSIISIILSVFLAFLVMISSVMPVVASADDSSSSSESSSAPQIEYSNVLDDLKKDKNFDETLYPVVADNYTLSVITVAESENLQLFVYVYQPSYGHKTLVASSINISVGTHTKLQYDNYDLNLVSQNGVFQKYVVTDLIVSTDEVNCYEISSIFRVWDSTIDDELDKVTENIIDEVSFSVGKKYTFEYTHGKLNLTVDDIELIKITSKFVGFLRYPDSFFDYDACDYHFIAFSTERKMDELLEVDVLYSYVGYADMTGSSGAYSSYFYPCECGESDAYDSCDTENCEPLVQEDIVSLTFGDTLDYDGGWLAKDYSFKVIEKTSDFLESADISKAYNMGVLDIVQNTKITEEAKKQIAKEQWCVRFLMTDYRTSEGASMAGHWYKACSTRVSAVSILRLQFVSDGVPFNLGVVDNKQTGSTNPVNSTEFRVEMKDWFEKLIALVAIVLLVVLYGTFLAPFVNPIISMIIKGALKGILLVIKLVFKILTLPLRLLFGLFKR